MKGWKKWVANGVLVTVATGLALIAAEVAVRIVAPRPTSIAHQDRYGLAMHYPGITRYRPQHDQTVTMNSAGMRDVEHALAKPSGTFRILVLGDSFMEAQQVAFESSLPHLIEIGLSRATGRNVEVINAGVSGWGTDDELRYLTEYGLAYDPDLVIVAMTLHNDISDNLREYWHTARDGNLVDLQREPIPWLIYKTLQLKAFLAVRFHLVQIFREVRHRGEMQAVGTELDSHVRALFDDPMPERIAFGWELTELLFERLQAAAAGTGAETVVVLLPIIYQLSPQGFDEFRGTPSAERRFQPQDRMARIAAELEMPLIDLMPGFEERAAGHPGSLYVEWDGHWNEAGHGLAADIVNRELLASGAIPTAAEP